ncbi:MAG: SGNH/GDSL hydrolase family protein [Pyrinomonadaceae bacterium]
MDNDSKNLSRWQRRYNVAAAAILPFGPLLFLQGQIARWKVGVLPDAAGERHGRYGGEGDAAKLFAIGESTIAGLGARDHERGFTGQFAKYLSEHLVRPVDWKVLGKNGVTARRTIEELVPQIPNEQFDYILVGLGGNDVIRLSSPRKWRHDMLELLGILRDKNPGAIIFLSNCPMIKYSPAIPQPARFLLWELSKMHDVNIKEFTRELDQVFYYPQPVDLRLEGFFADGLHPSEQGYSDWAEAMMRYFAVNYQW